MQIHLLKTPHSEKCFNSENLRQKLADFFEETKQHSSLKIDSGYEAADQLLKDSVLNIPHTHYKQIYKYSLKTYTVE